MSTSTPAGHRTHALGRAVTVLLTVAAVLAAGALVRVANDIEAGDRQLFVDARVDAPIEVAKGGTMRITAVHVGASAATDDGLLASVGRWVLIEYELSADQESIGRLDPQLRVGGDRIHTPIDEYDQRTPPGFTTTQAMLFDVPADGLTDMVFEVGPREAIHSHQRWIRWQVSLTEDEVRTSASATVFPLRSTMKVTP